CHPERSRCFAKAKHLRSRRIPRTTAVPTASQGVPIATPIRFSLFPAGLVMRLLPPRRLKLIALLPPDQPRKTSRLPTQGKSKARHSRVAHEVHLRMIFVAGLVIMLLDILLVLRHAPSFVVALELHSFIDRERRNAHPRHAEMIRSVEMPRLRQRIRSNRQPELLRRSLYPGIKRSPLRPRNLNILRSSQRLHVVVIQIQRNLPRRNRRMLSQILRPQQPLLL